VNCIYLDQDSDNGEEHDSELVGPIIYGKFIG